MDDCMKQVIGALLVVMFAGVGCSGGDSDSPQEDQSDAGTEVASDTEAPGFRDVSASIAGEFSSQIDLSESATRVLPVPAEAEFTVFADDNETAAGDLKVDVVDRDGNALETLDRSFKNGLWRVTVELEPGIEVRVRAEDKAGNSATTQSTLTIPTRAQALVDGWEQRMYSNADQSIEARYNLTISDDETWEEQRPNLTLGGTYTVNSETLVFSRTYLSTGDSDKQTVERQVKSEYYVDGTYMHRSPWTRKEGSSESSSGVAGTWKREYRVFKPAGGDLELKREITATLEFQTVDGGDNTWTRTRTGTLYDGGGESPINATVSGTWEIVENESYGGNFGDYLVRTTTHENGSELTDPTTETDLFHMPLDKLLISPYLDID